MKLQTVSKALLAIILFYHSTVRGQSWTELGGTDALVANGEILNICSDSAGNIYASGYFRNNSDNYYVAKWDGSSWTELGGLDALGANSIIYSM
jgi:hypothetical protein